MARGSAGRAFGFHLLTAPSFLSPGVLRDDDLVRSSRDESIYGGWACRDRKTSAARVLAAHPNALKLNFRSWIRERTPAPSTPNCSPFAAVVTSEMPRTVLSKADLAKGIDAEQICKTHVPKPEIGIRRNCGELIHLTIDVENELTATPIWHGFASGPLIELTVSSHPSKRP